MVGVEDRDCGSARVLPVDGDMNGGTRERVLGIEWRRRI